jgi:hypothetical protein
MIILNCSERLEPQIRDDCREHTHRAGITVVNRERKARHHREHNTTLPWSILAMSSDNTVNQSVANSVFNLDVVDDSSVIAPSAIVLVTRQGHGIRGDEELILDVDEMFRHLDS